MEKLKQIIEQAWDYNEEEFNNNKKIIKQAVEKTLNLMDKGELRVAQKIDGDWKINTFAKKAVLLSFKLNDNFCLEGAPQNAHWFDKVESKFKNWSAEDFAKAGIRAVPPAYVRYSSYIGNKVILMPSFVNVGAYVGDNTMVDTWVTVGSCAQIGKNCHLSGGVGIGGVLEPLQAAPVIVEDDCFIGARSEIVEGVIIRQGSVISMGVFIGASTKILDRQTGKIFYGEVPPYSVVVSGSMPSSDGKTNLYCAVIVKTVDEKTRSKTSINELLRD